MIHAVMKRVSTISDAYLLRQKSLSIEKVTGSREIFDGVGTINVRLMMLYAGSRLAVPLLTSVMSVRCFFEASKEDAKGATALTRLPIPALEGAL